MKEGPEVSEVRREGGGASEAAARWFGKPKRRSDRRLKKSTHSTRSQGRKTERDIQMRKTERTKRKTEREMQLRKLERTERKTEWCRQNNALCFVLVSFHVGHNSST
ncbi:hypothetical protein Drorol1_Dr00009046 [Drosera rotundifolia]